MKPSLAKMFLRKIQESLGPKEFEDRLERFVFTWDKNVYKKTGFQTVSDCFPLTVYSEVDSISIKCIKMCVNIEYFVNLYFYWAENNSM